MFSVDDDTSLLSFAGLDLMAAQDFYTLRALGSTSGMDFGSPQPVTATMQTFLQDGAAVATTRHDNRTLVLAVQVLADDAVGLSAGEDALVAACRSTWDPGAVAPVIWTPPAGMGPVCVFDCVAARLDPLNWSDFGELQPDTLGALYTLTLTCLPFARSDTLVTQTIPAPTSTTPITPTVVEIDDCTSTAGWAETPSGGTLTSSGGVNTAVVSMVTNLNMTRTGLSVAMGASLYVVVDVSMTITNGGTTYIAYPESFKLNGTVVAPVAGSGTKYYLPFSGTLTSVAITYRTTPLGSVASQITMSVADISKTDMISAGSITQMQVARQFAIQGSERSPASIAIRGVVPSTGADAALGQTLVYTTASQNAVTPPLRTVRVDGGSDSADATAYSGKKSALTTTHRFQQPINSVPSAGYLLVARVQAAATGAKTINWSAKTVVGSTTTSDIASGSASVTIAAANTWQVMTVALAALPPGQAGSTGKVEISLDSPTLTLDEAWLFDLDHGQLTILDATTSTHVWLDAASYVTPTVLVWAGTVADRSDSFVPTSAVAAKGAHLAPPPVLNIFVASAAPAEIGINYYPCGHTRAPLVA